MNDREVSAFHKRFPGREPHMVQPGETIEQIAAKHRVSPTRIKVMNGLAPNATLSPGQVLALPKRGAAPVADAASIRKNGYMFERDHISRTTHVSGDLALTATPLRSATNQREAGDTDRRRDDDGGHFIAARFNGPTDKFNHFAQNANFNRGRYRVMEDRWANALRAGKHVSVDIRAHYPGSSKRLDRIEVVWTVDRHEFRRNFVNARQEKPRDHR